MEKELPDFAFSQAVSCEVREAPSFVVLDFDLVHHMESTARKRPGFPRFSTCFLIRNPSKTLRCP